jgi:hypothetical protein
MGGMTCVRIVQTQCMGNGYDIGDGQGDITARATDALAWSLHVAFSGSWAWVEVFCHPMFG